MNNYDKGKHILVGGGEVVILQLYRQNTYHCTKSMKWNLDNTNGDYFQLKTFIFVQQGLNNFSIFTKNKIGYIGFKECKVDV